MPTACIASSSQLCNGMARRLARLASAARTCRPSGAVRAIAVAPAESGSR
jgi:hypothetical protein